jgi:hypothetical protein
VHQDRLAFGEVRAAVQAEEGTLVSDVQRGSGFGRHGVGDGEDAALGQDGDLFSVATAREGCGDHAQALLQIHALPDRDYGACSFPSRRERKLGALLVFAPAQEGIEEVQGRRFDFDDHFARTRLRFFHLLELQYLPRVSEFVYLPGAHIGVSFRSPCKGASLPTLARRDQTPASLLARVPGRW